jgi:hypothetical protein
MKGQSLLHTVSAYDTENGISLAQISTNNDEGKDVGEFNAIPKLISQLDITDAVVTIDAGGCYAEIVDAICSFIYQQFVEFRSGAIGSIDSWSLGH